MVSSFFHFIFLLTSLILGCQRDECSDDCPCCSSLLWFSLKSETGWILVQLPQRTLLFVVDRLCRYRVVIQSKIPCVHFIDESTEKSAMLARLEQHLLIFLLYSLEHKKSEVIFLSSKRIEAKFKKKSLISERFHNKTTKITKICSF